MNDTFDKILRLVEGGDVKISEHGYDEMADENILSRDVFANIKEAIVLEDYPDYLKGPCVLVLQQDLQGRPLHVVWGIPKGASSPAALVTAYRPDPELWTNDLMRRKK
jgi:hypothetical protein